MKLPTLTTTVQREPHKVYEFLSDPKYLNIYPGTPEYKIKRIDHLNSLPFGLGKKLRMVVETQTGEMYMDLEIYKFEPTFEIGYNLIELRGRNKKKIEGFGEFFPEFKFVFVLEEKSKLTKLQCIGYIGGVKNLFIRVLMYIVFGVFGYYRNKVYINKRGRLIEKHV